MSEADEKKGRHVIIELGDDVVLRIGSTLVPVGVLTEIQLKAISSDVVQRGPRTAEEYKQAVSGVRFFERGADIQTVAEFTFIGRPA